MTDVIDSSLMPTASVASVGRCYGDVYASGDARVIVGDFQQIMHQSSCEKPKDETLQEFANDNLVLVQKFVERMHALRNSLDQSNQAKSRALSNIAADIDELHAQMSLNQSIQENTNQQSTLKTPITVTDNLRILKAMNENLKHALDALEASLRMYKNEAERQEQEKMQRDIEQSRQRVTEIINLTTDSLMIASTAISHTPIKNRHVQDASEKMNDFAKHAGIINRGRDLFRKWRSSREEQTDSSQPRISNFHGNSTYRIVDSNTSSQSSASRDIRGSPTPRETYHNYAEGDRPEDRHSLPVRLRRDPNERRGQVQHSATSHGHESPRAAEAADARATPRPAILRGNWQAPIVTWQPPPSRSFTRTLSKVSSAPAAISNPSSSFRSFHEESAATTTSSPCSRTMSAFPPGKPPALPARAPEKPPRPNGLPMPDHGQPDTDTQQPRSSAKSTKEPPPLSPKPSHLSTALSSSPKAASPDSHSAKAVHLRPHPPTSGYGTMSVTGSQFSPSGQIPASPRSSQTRSTSPNSPSPALSSKTLRSPPQKKIVVVSDVENLTLAQKRDIVAGLISVEAREVD